MSDERNAIPQRGRPLKRESQCDRILAALRYRRDWLTTREIHRAAGFSRLNSRIAELRKRGYRIETRRIEGAPPGPDAQEYRLYESR